MKRNRLIGVVLAVVVAAVAGGGYWWSHRVAWTYQGLAGHFPSKVDAFVELKELGQWMPPSKSDGATAPAARSSRGTDPMLQVLQTVWAAPPVAPKDLPEIMRTKPMAAGFWLDGKTLKGAAIMPLAPGERAVVEKIIKEKLGDGPVVETLAGMEFRKIEASKVKGEWATEQILWGIGDQWIIVAMGLDGAKAVLSAPPTPLSQDLIFLSTLKKFPAQGGASLFVRGALMEQAARLGASHPETPDPKPAAQVEPHQVSPESEESQKPKSEAIGQIARAAMKAGLAKFLSMESLSALSLWTAPPREGEKGWEVQSWMALKDQPKGIWRLASQGTAKAPQIAGRLPKRGQAYVWGAGRDPARLYQDILDELSRDLPPDQMGWIRAGIGAAEGKVGISFANDLLPSLSDEWCFVSETGDGVGRGKDAGTQPAKTAFFIVLRDARRFEDLVSQKLAPQLKLRTVELKGARAWSMGEGDKSMNLVVSGGMAILTGNPAWALDTGGSSDKAWKLLSDQRQKSCILAVADLSRPSEPADVLMKFECLCGPEGILVKGRFPGQAPGWFKGGHGCDRGTDSLDDESRSSESSGEAKGAI